MTIESQAATLTLEEQLQGVRNHIASVAPGAAVEAIQTDIDKLIQSGIAEGALKVGQTAPDFTLTNVQGQPVKLSDKLAQGPVVLVFYRGEWCPYCNLTLRTYQKDLSRFQELGAQLVAVSPQTADHSLAVATKNELTFEVLNDRNNNVAREYGLVFKVGEDLRPHLSGLGADVPTFDGEDSWELPIPGVYVIGQDGLVRLAHVDPDFRNRPEPEQLLAALRQA